MKLTEEQNAVIEAVKKYDRIKILALAGTGKTTTLKAVAEHFKDKRVLFLAFNSSVKAECEKKFPENVEVYTVHGYAFKYYKSIFKTNQISNTSLNLNFIEHHLHLFDLKSSFGQNFIEAIKNKKSISLQKKNSLYKLITHLRSIYENYLHSDEEDLETFVKTHEAFKDALQTASSFHITHLNPEKELSEFLESLFILQVRNIIPISHDVYVKWFANCLPDVYKDKYDIVLLDEAQDSNMVTEQILERLPIKKKIIVGDSHQKIYGFRKAIAVIDLWQADATLTLTTTFRCPEHVCEYANRILEWKNSNIFLKSFKDKQEEPVETVAYLSRTNSALIDIMLNLNKANQDYRTVKPLEELFRVPRAVDAYFQGNKEPAQKLLPYVFKEDFIDMDHLEKHANEENNSELILAIRILKKLKNMGMDIESAYRLCKEKLNENSTRTLVTAHSSKGLEWDSVIIYNDFPYLPIVLARAYFKIKRGLDEDIFDIYQDLIKKVFKDKDASYKLALDIVSEAIEEVNLYYVAITRAKAKLEDKSENKFIKSKKALMQRVEEEFSKIIQATKVKNF